MRILVDENLPRSLAVRLRRAGHDAVDLRELGRTGIPDAEVLAIANADERILLSANYKHFGNIVLFPPAESCGHLGSRATGQSLREESRLAVASRRSPGVRSSMQRGSSQERLVQGRQGRGRSTMARGPK